MSSAASALFGSSDVINTGASKKNWAWQHCTIPDPHDYKKLKCKYCQHVSNGGIHRFKRHLAGIKGSIRSCEMVPEDVKNRAFQSLIDIKERKAGNAKMPELRGTLRPRDEEDNHDMGEMRGSSSSGLKRQKSLDSPVDVVGVAKQTTLSQTTLKCFIEQQAHKVCFSMYDWMKEAVSLSSFDVMCETIRQCNSTFRKPTAEKLCELLLKNLEMAEHEHNWSTSEKVSEAVEHALAKKGPAKTGGSERETCRVLHNQQEPQMPSVVPDTQHLTLGGGTTSAGYNGHQLSQHSVHSHHVSSDTHIPLENTSVLTFNQWVSSAQQTQTTKDDSTGQTFAPPQERVDFWPMGQSKQQSNLNTRDYLCCIPSSGLVLPLVGSQSNLQLSYLPLMGPNPIFNSDIDRSRSSRNAAVRWLKIKAAIRLGIFVRKKAAERRAQLVELDD